MTLTTFTDLRSRLWAHLRSLAPANRHTDLAPADYQQARYVALAERCDFHGGHRHTCLEDAAEYADKRLQDDVASWLMSGDEAAKERGWDRLCAAYTAAANVCIDNRLRELRQLRMAGARTSEPAAVPFTPRPDWHDPEADELAGDMRAERAQRNERMAEYVAEVVR